MPEVELHDAYVWTCDACGRDCFVRAVTVEMTDDDIVAMQIRHGGEPEDWQTGKWITRPDEVTCDHCGKTYTVEQQAGPEDE